VEPLGSDTDAARFCSRAFAYYWLMADRAVSVGWDEAEWHDYLALQFRSFQRFLDEEDPLDTAGADKSRIEALSSSLAATSTRTSMAADLIRGGDTPNEANEKARAAHPILERSREIVLDLIDDVGEGSDACGELQTLLEDDRWLCTTDQFEIIAQERCTDGEPIGPA
jgi:hypothetical protein